MNSHIANQLKHKLRSNAIGIFTKTSDSSLIEAASLSDVDFLILDTEHSCTSKSTILNHIRAANLHSCPTIVRVSGVNSNEIGTALDSGATGVQVPNISTAEEAQLAVNAARFHPLGTRGVCRFVRSAQFGAMDKNTYFEESNNNLLILQVEGRLGIENLDKILAVDGYDVLFIGPYDLSQSIGEPGNLESPKLLELISNVILRSKAAGKFVGMFTDSHQAFFNYKKLGVNYMTYSVDLDIFRTSLDRIVKDFR